MKPFSKQGYRPFWITFFLTLLILGTAFVIYFLILTHRTAQANASENNLPVSSYTPQPSDSKNILLIGGSDRAAVPDFYLLLRFDAPNNRCYLVPVPPQSEVTVNVKTMTVTEHYEYGSSAYAREAVENLFLINVHHYIRLDNSAIAHLVDFFGGIEYDLPYEVDTEHFSLSDGLQLLDGSRIAEIANEGDYELIAALASAYLETNLVEAQWEKRERLYNIIFNETDTDLTSLEAKRTATARRLFYYYPENKTEVLLLDGEFSEEGRVFTPDEESLSRIKNLLTGNPG